MNHDNTVDYVEIRRQIWQTLADNDDISLHPSEERFHWEVSVDGLGLRFDPIPLYDWSQLLMCVKAAAGAVDAVRSDLKAIDEAIMREWEEEYRVSQEKLKKEQQED